MGKNIREGEHDTPVHGLRPGRRRHRRNRRPHRRRLGRRHRQGDRRSQRRLGRSRPRFPHLRQDHERAGVLLDLQRQDRRRAGAEPSTSPTREPLDGWGGIGGNGGMETTHDRQSHEPVPGRAWPISTACVPASSCAAATTAARCWRRGTGGTASSPLAGSSIPPRTPTRASPTSPPAATVDPAVGLNKITDNAGSWNGAQPGEWMVWDRDGVKEHRQVVAVTGNVLTVDENMTPGTNKGAHVYGYSGMGNHNLVRRRC